MPSIPPHSQASTAINNIPSKQGHTQRHLQTLCLHISCYANNAMNVIRACVNKTMNAVKMTPAAVSNTEHMSCIPAVGLPYKVCTFHTATSVRDRAPPPHTHTPTRPQLTRLHLLYVPLTCITVTILEYCFCTPNVPVSFSVSISVRVWYYLCIVGRI